MVLVVFNTLLTLGNKTSLIWKLHQSEQPAVFTSAPRMNPKQIFVVVVLFLFCFKEHPNMFYVKLEVSYYLSEWEDWRDILLTGFCPGLMSPMLIVMSLISTPVAGNEWHSGGSTAQLGPGPADSDLAAYSRSPALNWCSFQWKPSYALYSMSAQSGCFFNLGLEIIRQTVGA